MISTDQITEVFGSIVQGLDNQDALKLWRVLGAAGRPLKMPEICDEARLADRPARLLLARMRAEGLPICAGAAGYWISNNPAEIRETARRFRSRAKQCNTIASSLERAAYRLDYLATFRDRLDARQEDQLTLTL